MSGIKNDRRGWRTGGVAVLAVTAGVGLPASGTAAEQPPSDIGNDGPVTPDLSPVAGLLAEWGQSCPRYDLSGDGTVDIRDLLALLADLGDDAFSVPPDVGEVGDQPVSAAPVPPPDVHMFRSPFAMAIVAVDDADLASDPRIGDRHSSSPVDELFAEWGRSCPRHDLNADGTVDIRDLLIALNDMGYEPVPPAVPGIPGDVDDVPLAAPPAVPQTGGEDDPANRSAVDDLLSEWGQSCPPRDRDGDRSIRIDDLTISLSELDGFEAVAAGPGVGLYVFGSDGELSAQAISITDDWSHACPRYDLDGDGIVGMSDLLILLAQLG